MNLNLMVLLEIIRDGARIRDGVYVVNLDNKKVKEHTGFNSLWHKYSCIL